MELDLTELGIELEEGQAAALKEALAGKVTEAVDKQVTGLKAKNQELLGTNKTLKDDLGAFKGQFDGLDIEAVKAIVSKAGQDEESRLIAEGNVDEVVSRRTERLRGDLEGQIQAEKDRADKAETFANRFKDKVLSDFIREAAAKAGALPEAAEDIILRARRTFNLSEEGIPTALDPDGQVIYGKDGKTPLTPSEWVESMREAAPHLWPRPQGAGQTGDRGGKSNGKKRSEMTMQEKSAYIHEHGQDAFLKLPK